MTTSGSVVINRQERAGKGPEQSYVMTHDSYVMNRVFTTQGKKKS